MWTKHRNLRSWHSESRRPERTCYEWVALDDRLSFYQSEGQNHHTQHTEAHQDSLILKSFQGLNIFKFLSWLHFKASAKPSGNKWSERRSAKGSSLTLFGSWRCWKNGIQWNRPNSKPNRLNRPTWCFFKGLLEITLALGPLAFKTPHLLHGFQGKPRASRRPPAKHWGGISPPGRSRKFVISTLYLKSEDLFVLWRFNKQLLT